MTEVMGGAMLMPEGSVGCRLRMPNSHYPLAFAVLGACPVTRCDGGLSAVIRSRPH